MAHKGREEARRARQSQKRAKAVSYLLIVTGVVGIAGYLLFGALYRPSPPPLAGNVIDIAAAMSGFDKTEIHIKLGQPVTIRLTSLDNSYHSDGGGKHQWAVDELGINIIAQPMSSSTKTFTPMKSGTYMFYCDVCCGGRANPSMQGTLVVEG